MTVKAYTADFGAGNTSIFAVEPFSRQKNIVSLIRTASGGVPSGYAESGRGNILVGLDLYDLRYKDIERFRINIKTIPNEANKRELIRYFNAWLTQVKQQNEQEFRGVTKSYWFIGCPTGDEWKLPGVRALYKNIFEQAGFENVYLIPESSAALAFFNATREEINSVVDGHRNYGSGTIGKHYKEGTALLLIDQGAYSIDATHYSNEDEVKSFGGYLGASLIEKMLLRTILYTDDEQTIRVRKREFNYKPTVEALRSLYEREGSEGVLHTFLLLQARRLKEDYFTKISGREKSIIEGHESNINIDDDDLKIDGDNLVLFMNNIISETIIKRKPVRELLGSEFDSLAPEVQAEIGGQTWLQAFNSFLGRLDARFSDLGNGKDVIIMLTGGGSNMDCVAEAVSEHYPEAVLYRDREAINTIAKGMAYWAPDKIEAIIFEEAFEQFINKEVED